MLAMDNEDVVSEVVNYLPAYERRRVAIVNKGISDTVREVNMREMFGFLGDNVSVFKSRYSKFQTKCLRKNNSWCFRRVEDNKDLFFGGYIRVVGDALEVAYFSMSWIPDPNENPNALWVPGYVCPVYFDCIVYQDVKTIDKLKGAITGEIYGLRFDVRWTPSPTFFSKEDIQNMKSSIDIPILIAKNVQATWNYINPPTIPDWLISSVGGSFSIPESLRRIQHWLCEPDISIDNYAIWSRFGVGFDATSLKYGGWQIRFNRNDVQVNGQIRFDYGKQCADAWFMVNLHNVNPGEKAEFGFVVRYGLETVEAFKTLLTKTEWNAPDAVYDMNFGNWPVVGNE